MTAPTVLPKFFKIHDSPTSKKLKCTNRDFWNPKPLRNANVYHNPKPPKPEAHFHSQSSSSKIWNTPPKSEIHCQNQRRTAKTRRTPLRKIKTPTHKQAQYRLNCACWTVLSLLLLTPAGSFSYLVCRYIVQMSLLPWSIANIQQSTTFSFRIGNVFSVSTNFQLSSDSVNSLQ